jgi:hypothetical protein
VKLTIRLLTAVTNNVISQNPTVRSSRAKQCAYIFKRPDLSDRTTFNLIVHILTNKKAFKQNEIRFYRGLISKKITLN